jgi:hypothetical protein
MICPRCLSLAHLGDDDVVLEDKPAFCANAGSLRNVLFHLRGPARLALRHGAQEMQVSDQQQKKTERKRLETTLLALALSDGKCTTSGCAGVCRNLLMATPSALTRSRLLVCCFPVGQVIAHLRAGVAVPTVRQAIVELVLNAIDAGATDVAIHVRLSVETREEQDFIKEGRDQTFLPFLISSFFFFPFL